MNVFNKLMFFTLLIISVHFTFAVDYCLLCDENKIHIACNNTGVNN